MIITDLTLINDRKYTDLADAEFGKRRSMVNTHVAYYNGEHKKQLVKSADNITYNLCKQVVDETVAFLLPFTPKIESDMNQEFLNESWDAIGGATVLQEMATYGSITGHVFVMLMPRANGLPPQVTIIPTENVIQYVATGHSSAIIGYEIRWGNERQLIVLEGDTWVIYEYTLKGRKWELVDDPIVWQYTQCPIVSWKHNPSIGSVYGASDIPHYAMNDDVNKIASDVNAILRYHASPTTVGTGFIADELIQTSIDGFMSIKSPDAKVYNLEMSSDLSSSMSMLETLVNRFFRQARVVIIEGVDNFRGMTNLGVRASFAPMIAHNETLRRQYSEGIKRISMLMLELSDLPTDVRISVVWGEALPVDASQELSLIERQVALGVMDIEQAKQRLGL